MSFVKPSVNLNSSSQDRIRTLIDLVEFHIHNNPKHLFCTQAEDQNSSENPNFATVNYSELEKIILKCQSWLLSHIPAIHAPVLESDGAVKKSEPIALLMESNLSLAAYILSLMGLGVPVVLLSARLSPLAVRHLIRATGSKTALVSQRLLPILSEAFTSSDSGKRTNGENNQCLMNGNLKDHANGADELKVCIAAGYESFADLTEADGGRIAVENHYISEEDRNVLILHSSGTSGLPKPIYCSHRHFLGFSQCEDFHNATERAGLTVSTSPFFHGFGLVPICLSLGLGKPFCIPPSTQIPTGSSIVDLIESSKAKALLTVPSLLEEIAELPDGRGIQALKTLDFVAFGGGLPKSSAAEKLDAEGVKLINHYGATETGPLTPFFVPPQGHDWHYIHLRRDIVAPLDMKFELIDPNHPRGCAYKLSLRPFGWQGRFELQDLLIPRTQDSFTEFSIAGRTDDLICLATGEKVRPTILETSLRQHEDVRAAVAVGDGQFELVVVIEPTIHLDKTGYDALRKTLWPLIEEAGRQMDAHARVSSPAAVVIVPPGTLPRSDKGTILRREVNERFSEEIGEAYRKLEADVIAPAFDPSAPEMTIGKIVRSCLQWRTPIDQLSDEDDFFDFGMDSLQATKLRRVLIASIKAAQREGLRNLEGVHVTDDIVYRHPSIRRLVQAIKEPQTSLIPAEIPSLEDLAEEYVTKTPRQQTTATVLITGSTGSLGAFFLAHLLSHDLVSRVICLVRQSGGDDALGRQKHAMKARGINITEDQWSRTKIYAANIHMPHFGLDESTYKHIASNTTHVVHVAWPMNFKMSLLSYRASMKALQNMIQFSRDASKFVFKNRSRLLFVSSISTVGNTFPVLGERFVPEEPVTDDRVCLDLGYAKAKLVCEKIVERAASAYPEIDIGYVRVGQIAGSKGGFWNAEEHFAALIGSSQKLKRLPDLQGTLSWIPVDIAAAVLSEIVFNSEPLRLVYHLENPVRQSWQEILQCLREELKLSEQDVIPFDDWLNLVKTMESASADDNPAQSLCDFLETEFRKMSCGSVILDTAVSRNVSPTLRKLGYVENREVRSYLRYWRSIGLIR